MPGKSRVSPNKRSRRFEGTSEGELLVKTLPDHISHDLDILIIGINPGLTAAHVGHHYAGPGNHFWKCLYLSGLVSEPLTAFDDSKLIHSGIGFTNIVARTTRGSADLSRKEVKEGADILTRKLQTYRPKIAVFNGKGIYQVYSGRKDFDLGKQPEPVPGTSTLLFVMPSSSARCAQFPRAADKVHYYVALKYLRDYLVGKMPTLREDQVIFYGRQGRVGGQRLKREPRDGGEEVAGEGKPGGGEGNNTRQPQPTASSEAAEVQVPFESRSIHTVGLRFRTSKQGHDFREAQLLSQHEFSAHYVPAPAPAPVSTLVPAPASAPAPLYPCQPLSPLISVSSIKKETTNSLISPYFCPPRPLCPPWLLNAPHGYHASSFPLQSFPKNRDV